MKSIRATAKRRRAILNSTVPSSENFALAKEINDTTRIVGISIHLLSKGFLSAISNSTPQENAIADASPIGYTVSVTPILSGIHARIAMMKSAIAAIQ